MIIAGGKKLNKRKGLKGAMTAEAALVFPIFIFAMIAFLSLFQIILTQGKLQWALMETSLQTARYAYVYQDLMEEENEEKSKTKTTYHNVLNHLEDGVFYQQCFEKYMKDEKGNWLYHKNFFTGNISFLKSKFLQDGENIDVIALYQIKLPIEILTGHTYTFVQRSRVRGFIGTTRFGIEKNNISDDLKDEIVYITDTGTVYHRSKSCSHLNLNISDVNFSEVASLRNENGGKYKPCEKCVGSKKIADGDTVYIAKEGDCYHMDRNCSGLKRTVKAVRLSEVAERRPCTRCGH